MADSARRAVGSASDVRSGGRLTITLADLARRVIVSETPDQVELLGEVTAQWEAGHVPRRRRWALMSGSVNFGIDPAVLSELIYPVLTATFAQVLGDVTLIAWRRWRGRSRPQSVPRMQITLSVNRFDEVIPVCIAQGRDSGCSEAKARLLADAVYRELSRALEESQQRK